MSKSKTIIFFGNERLATGVTTTAPTLSRLIDAGYSVAALVVNQASYKSRQDRQLEVEVVANKNHIPILSPYKLSSIEDQIKSYGATTGILAAYGKIVPSSTIKLFPKGIINIHPSLLPIGRGPTPIEDAIINGRDVTGVSIMQLVEKMDAGPVFAQSKIKLGLEQSKQDLADKLLQLGGDMLLELLPSIIDGTAMATPQVDSKATYNNLIKKEDGIIDWQQSATVIDRKVRAYAVWPKCRCQLGKQEVILTGVTPNNSISIGVGEIKYESSKLLVGCSSGTLEIKRLQPLNKPEMTAVSFWAGYKKNIL